MSKLDESKVIDAKANSPKNAKEIERIADRARILELLADTGEHQGVTYLIEQMKVRVNDINQHLANYSTLVTGKDGAQKSRFLTEQEARELCIERQVYVDLIELFPNCQKNLESLIAKIDRYASK